MGGSSTVSSADSKPNDDLNKLECGATSTGENSDSSDVTIERKAAGTDATDGNINKQSSTPAEDKSSSGFPDEAVIYRNAAGASAPVAVGGGEVPGLNDKYICSIKCCIIYWAVHLIIVAFMPITAFFAGILGGAIGCALTVWTIAVAVLCIMGAVKNKIKLIKIAEILNIVTYIFYLLYIIACMVVAVLDHPDDLRPTAGACVATVCAWWVCGCLQWAFKKAKREKDKDEK